MISQSTASSVMVPAGPHGFAPDWIHGALQQIRQPVHVVLDRSSMRMGLAHEAPDASAQMEICGTLPPLYPEWLGDRAFCADHDVRFPYVVGEMANGIATVGCVTAAARTGALGFFGAAGLASERILTAVETLSRSLGDNAGWGVNLIHSPGAPNVENEVADLLVRKQVPSISLSAFMEVTPAVVRCAASGLTRRTSGEIVRRTSVFAKVSRPETARMFLSPPPPALLADLVDRGLLTHEEANLARHVPMAQDVTVEADSGGHTDNRPLTVLLPAIIEVAGALAREHGYAVVPRVGAAGGLGTPAAVAGAFALGAAYVVTGSVNQSCREAGLSVDAKAMLAGADVADVVMAPAADMFELGVKVQVLRRGTLFAARAGRLWETYRDYPSLDSIPAQERATLERQVLHATLDEIWAETETFWMRRDTRELDRAARDPKHRMALVFRWYLGNATRWAISGTPDRRTDYQIWCGPAMGAFNRWVRGTFLADPACRTVAQVALNLLEGAAVVTRAHQARAHGVPVPHSAFHFVPRRLA